MTDSEILQALINAEIAMTGKGYPDARILLTCERDKWHPNRPWTAVFYVNQWTTHEGFIGSFEDALTAILALSNAVEDVEPRPRDWTLEEVAATLGIAPEYQEAAE